MDQKRLGEFQVVEVVAICDHLRLLGLSESVAEIFGESLSVSFDLLIEPLGRDSVKPCKIGIDQHGLSAKVDDGNVFRFGHRKL